MNTKQIFLAPIYVIYLSLHISTNYFSTLFDMKFYKTCTTWETSLYLYAYVIFNVQIVRIRGRFFLSISYITTQYVVRFIHNQCFESFLKPFSQKKIKYILCYFAVLFIDKKYNLFVFCYIIIYYLHVIVLFSFFILKRDYTCCFQSIHKIALTVPTCIIVFTDIH